MHRTYRILGGNQMRDPASIVAGPYAAADPYHFCNGSVPTAAGAALPVSAGLNCANPKDPVYQTLPAGSNSITGLPDISTGIWTDSNTSFYAEADTNIFTSWELDLAVRTENYASFGTNTSAKVATYLQLTDWLALRGSAGTGFHAPPPGMLNQTNVQLTTVNGQPVQSGLFPAYNPVAKFLGAKPLEPEKAANLSNDKVARANPQFLVPNTTAGSLGQILYIYGKNNFSWDAAITKAFRLTERTKFAVFASASNILNHPSWGMPSTNVFSTSFGTVGAPSGNRTMTFRGTLTF